MDVCLAALANGCRRVEGFAMEAYNGGRWGYLQPADEMRSRVLESDLGG